MDSNQFKTASLIVRPGNVVAWLRNQRMQQKDITSRRSDVIRYILKHREQSISAGDLMERLSLSPLYHGRHSETPGEQVPHYPKGR